MVFVTEDVSLRGACRPTILSNSAADGGVADRVGVCADGERCGSAAISASPLIGTECTLITELLDVDTAALGVLRLDVAVVLTDIVKPLLHCTVLTGDCLEYVRTDCLNLFDNVSSDFSEITFTPTIFGMYGMRRRNSVSHDRARTPHV